MQQILAVEKGEIWLCSILFTSLWIEEWVAVFYFCREFGSCGLKASKEGRIFDKNYPVFLSTLHEQNLYPLSFSEWVNNCALTQPVKFYICNELWNTKLWKELNSLQRIWNSVRVLTEFQMFPDHKRSTEADSLW